MVIEKRVALNKLQGQLNRLVFHFFSALPVRLAAAALVAIRLLQGRVNEAKAYAWLAGLRGTAPSGDASDFESEEYFLQLEDASYKEYMESNLQLVCWSTPKKDDRICDFGCGRGFLLLRLKETGYTNLVGYELSVTAVAKRITPEVVLFAGFDSIGDRSFDTVCLISVLEHIEPEALSSFLSGIVGLARQKIVCCIPTHPTNLFNFFERDLTHRILARRSWWDRQFAEIGFEPDTLPPANLPFVEPYIYRRRADVPFQR